MLGFIARFPRNQSCFQCCQRSYELKTTNYGWVANGYSNHEFRGLEDGCSLLFFGYIGGNGFDGDSNGEVKLLDCFFIESLAEQFLPLDGSQSDICGVYLSKGLPPGDHHLVFGLFEGGILSILLRELCGIFYGEGVTVWSY